MQGLLVRWMVRRLSAGGTAALQAPLPIGLTQLRGTMSMSYSGYISTLG
jgi:hypothetical protein